jgi:hypothetical protein
MPLVHTWPLMSFGPRCELVRKTHGRVPTCATRVLAAATWRIRRCDSNKYESRNNSPRASRSTIAAITAPKIILPDESKGHSGSRQILTFLSHSSRELRIEWRLRSRTAACDFCSVQAELMDEFHHVLRQRPPRLGVQPSYGGFITSRLDRAGRDDVAQVSIRVTDQAE